MAMKKPKRLELPALPSAWNELTMEETESIHRLRLKSNLNAQDADPDKMRARFRLAVFLMLGNFKVMRKAYPKEDGSFIYIIRRKGWRYKLLHERIPVQSWQVYKWTEHFLRFLDDPNSMTCCPYRFVTLKGKTFQGPDELMVNVTYEQYGNAQRFLMAYWNTIQAAGQIADDKRGRKETRRLMKESDGYKAQFLATMFCPEGTQVQFTDESGTYRTNRKVWVYNACQSEENARYFAGKKTDILFSIMVQFVQGCLNYYKSSFPDLFTDHKGNEGKDFIVMESNNVNAIKKYASFPNYQDVYNSNMFFIFGVMDAMCKEAKAMKDMEKKIKRKK